MGGPDHSPGADRGPGHRPEGSFTRAFFREMFRNALVLAVALACVAAGAFVGQGLRHDGYGALVGTVAGLVVGIPLARWIYRRTA